eukprot:CAMPEP_0172431512 /NCGR_PEP_ID=MMETSP1064-20121228/58767_1 /TAXON_ID=202472 /ORGANISM="Aulacoseira subarctica , Strain CCAP 1002/5" /LENGTH=473 /DNA_ID=CAMNT_0013178241 /DNA_START=58 /DNA_END=1479 /DNA_ORIENTATION=-
MANAGGRRGLSSVDLYRRVPKDLTESTYLGIAMSAIVIVVMVILFISETMAFARSSVVTSVAVDESSDLQLRINFNLTFIDLNCDFIVVDVVDALGTNRQNVTKNVDKWNIWLHDKGATKEFWGRNGEQQEFVHEEHSESLSELHENGVDVVPLSSVAAFNEFLGDNENAFVNFFKPGCRFCDRMHATWEKFAEEVVEQDIPLRVASVDCAEQKDMCAALKINAYPLLRWYKDSSPEHSEYKSDRTVSALVEFSKKKFEMLKKTEEHDKRMLEEPDLPKRPIGFMRDQAACNVAGHIFVNRVPGNFHVEARSKNHDLNAAMTNMSHFVHHLSFGNPDPISDQKRDVLKRILKQVPHKHKKFFPLDRKLFFTQKFHQVYHHYIKVVQTHFDMKGETMSTYQFLSQSQVVLYDEVTVPEARFSYDLSPMSVTVQKESRKWYDYLTSLCAIIGGAFTTFGLIDSSLSRVLKTKKFD